MEVLIVYRMEKLLLFAKTNGLLCWKGIGIVTGSTLRVELANLGKKTFIYRGVIWFSGVTWDSIRYTIGRPDFGYDAKIVRIMEYY